MFVTAVRPTSRRALLGCVVGAIFLVMSFMAVKDMNDKLTLMTVSNANYQVLTTNYYYRRPQSTKCTGESSVPKCRKKCSR